MLPIIIRRRTSTIISIMLILGDLKLRDFWIKNDRLTKYIYFCSFQKCHKMAVEELKFFKLTVEKKMAEITKMSRRVQRNVERGKWIERCLIKSSAEWSRHHWRNRRREEPSAPGQRIPRGSELAGTGSKEAEWSRAGSNAEGLVSGLITEHLNYHVLSLTAKRLLLLSMPLSTLHMHQAHYRYNTREAFSGWTELSWGPTALTENMGHR